MPARNTAARYGWVAKALHWVTVGFFLALIPMGLIMAELRQIAEAGGDPGVDMFALFQLHKSIALTLVPLILLRILWRLAGPIPALPDGTKRLEGLLAHGVHLGLYAGMIIMPVSGYLMASASVLEIPTIYFGLVELPHVLSPDADTERLFKTIHWGTTYAILGLLALHVAGALKHHVIAKDGVLRRMLPDAGLKPLWLGGAGGAAALALALAVTLPRADQGLPAGTATAPPAEAPAQAATADPWAVAYGDSQLGFVAQQGATRFQGHFADWTAEIRFDPDALDASRAVIDIAIGSIDAGDSVRTSTAKQTEWFNQSAFPNAEFRTTAFRHLGENRYEADAVLTIKGVSNRVTLPFTLDIRGDTATMVGDLTIDRTSWGVGSGQWANANTIKLEVTIQVRLTATRGDGSGPGS